MTGMKEGAGEDPFATDDTSEADREHGDTPSEDSSQTAPRDREPQEAEESTSMQIPYKYRRDGVQDGRDRVPLFLQSETKSDERAAQRELEDRFGDDVSLTDLREAVMKVGLQHLDEVEAHLEEWGYGLTFDES